LIHDRAKCLWLVYGQIGQNFAVNFDTRKRQTVDERLEYVSVSSCIRTAALIRWIHMRGNYACDCLTVTCCVLVGLIYGLTQQL
jgi:hypothetical protein